MRHGLHGAAVPVRQCRYWAAGVSGAQFATVDKALDERTIGHNPERLSLLQGGIVYSNQVRDVRQPVANFEQSQPCWEVFLCQCHCLIALPTQTDLLSEHQNHHHQVWHQSDVLPCRLPLCHPPMLPMHWGAAVGPCAVCWGGRMSVPSSG